MPRVAKPKPKGRLMSQKDIELEIGVKRLQAVRWGCDPRTGFPSPVRIVGRTYLFKRTEVEKWAEGGIQG